ncbi:Ulilysin [Orbilia brochopaga]|nr:Ulilysin [Drechslerella brochopaga]
MAKQDRIDLANDKNHKGTTKVVPMITVDTYFHIVYDPANPIAGNIPAGKLSRQLKALNDGFAASRITFNLKNVTRTGNKTWTTFDTATGDPVETQMKAKLRKGDYKTLNIYFRPRLDEQGDLGFCDFPTDLSSAVLVNDGCTVLSNTVPGGSTGPFNQGKTAVHEVGHWFGLLHTFQGGCTSPGDAIDDTPAEAEPAFGCPVNRDSCKKLPGKDPIHNFMDYGDDACITQFTAAGVRDIYHLGYHTIACVHITIDTVN